MLTVLSVGYPFATITQDSAGGAEQILARLDHALVETGHRSIVIAPEDSSVSGELGAVPAVAGEIDDSARASVHPEVRERIREVVSREQVDLVHYHGIDFGAYAVADPPQLATMHLPIDWYEEDALYSGARLLPVSDNQAKSAPDGLALLPPIQNGVDLTLYRPAVLKRDYALVLGRIAPEKGFHNAIAAARKAGVPLIAAGALFPYAAHQAYFEKHVAPAMGPDVRWAGPVAGAAKRKLIAEARCLLVPSTAPETSSLVAMEALASGTPVIAYRSGALPDVVEHGVTGFVVDDVASMADAITRIDAIAPVACRAAAETRFCARRMTGEYLDLYARLAA